MGVGNVLWGRFPCLADYRETLRTNVLGGWGEGWKHQAQQRLQSDPNQTVASVQEWHREGEVLRVRLAERERCTNRGEQAGCFAHPLRHQRSHGPSSLTPSKHKVTRTEPPLHTLVQREGTSGTSA